eukprot:gene22251-30493_t
MNGCDSNAENLISEHDDNSEQSILNALLDVERDQRPGHSDEGDEMVMVGESAEEDEGMSICNSVKRKKALRKAPHAPKRFKSAYIYFIMDKMEELRSSAGESLKVTDMMKQLAVMWNSLPAEYKKQYEEIACTDKERWLNDLAHYTGPMQVPNRRQKKPPGAPKRAISAFLSFSQQMRPVLRDIHPGLRNSELSIVLADKWRAASEEEKRPHLERELRERGVYHDLMNRWKEGEREKEQERVREKAVAAEDFAAAAAADRAAAAEDQRSQRDAQQDPQFVSSSRSSDVDRKSPDLLPLETLEEHEFSDWDVDNLHHHLVDYVSFMDSELEMKDSQQLEGSSFRGGQEAAVAVAAAAAPVGEPSAADSKGVGQEKGPPARESDTYRYMHSFESFLDRSSSYYMAAPPFAAPADMHSKQVEEFDGEPCFSLSELFSPDYVPFSSMLLDAKNASNKGGEQNSGKSHSSSSGGGGKDGPSEAAPVDKPKRKYTFINRNRRKTSKVEPPKDGNPPVQQPAGQSASSNSNNNNNNINSNNNSNNNKAAEMFYHKNHLPLAPPLDLFMALSSSRSTRDSNEAKNSTSSAQSQSKLGSDDAPNRLSESTTHKAGNVADLHWLEQVRSTQQMLDLKKKKEQDMQRTQLSEASITPGLSLNRSDNLSSQEAFVTRGSAGEREGGHGPGPYEYSASQFSVAPQPQPYPPTYRKPADDRGPRKVSDEDFLDSLFPSSQTDAGPGHSKDFESIRPPISYPPLVLHDKNSLYAQFDFDSFLLPSQEFEGGEQFRGGAAINIAGSGRKDSHSNSSGSTTPATGASDMKLQQPAAALQRSNFQLNLHDFAPGSTPASFFDEKAEQQQLLSHLLQQEQEEHKQLQQKIAQRAASKAVKSKSANRKDKDKSAKQQKGSSGDPLAASYNPQAGKESSGLPYHPQMQHRPPFQAAAMLQQQQQRPPPAPSLPLAPDADSESVSATALPSSSSTSSSSTSRKKNRSTKVTETLRDKSLQTLQGFGNSTADYDDLVYGSARDH